MLPTSIPSATMAHIIPPERLRAVVLNRRIAVSEHVARVMAELAYGASREHWSALPASTVRQTEVRA